TISIYKSSTNELFESLSVTSSRVKILTNKSEVTIDPQKDFDFNTSYYVLVSAGAFVNVSNGNGYAGIQGADKWNFITMADEVVKAPELIWYDPQGSFIPTTTPITLMFDEPVFAASGSITLVSGDDSRSIAVTSTEVQGSGSDTIVITPKTALQPNRSYKITIGNGLFKDATGLSYTGSNWTFTTMDSAVQLDGPFSPTDDSINVELNSELVMTFNTVVEAIANKYVEIKVVGTNTTYQKIRATSTTIEGNIVRIKPSPALKANTSYYVTIEPGAYGIPGSTDTFSGITNASTWNFTTKDSSAPLVEKLTPANKGAAPSVNTKLEMTFNENVLPSSGNIEIRVSSTGALFRSIPVTSDLVTGGGTKTITIDPNKAYNGEAKKPFVNNTKYYVIISNTAFRDISSNYYAGIQSTTGWTFTVTNDTVKPVAISQSPANNAIAVKENPEFNMIFSENIALSDELLAGTAKIMIYRIGTGGGQSSYDTVVSIDSTNERKLIIQPVGLLNKSTSYYVYIAPNAITDTAGNYYVGIQNEYQWTFKTIGTDTTPPVISKLEANDSSIIMTYNEELN
ncbi:Ig-like domain-containing protein, partial [Paenibacillus sp. MCAF20]